jgi:hypothetical protein
VRRPEVHAFPSRTRTEAHRSPHSVPWSAAPESPPVRPLPPGARRLHKWRSAFSSRVCASSTSPCPATGRITPLRRPLLVLTVPLTFPTPQPPRRSSRSRGRHGTASRNPAAGRPSALTPNRPVVSPGPSSTHPPSYPASSSPEFWPEPPATMPKDPIASSQLFPGWFLRTRGTLVRNQKFQGPA